MEIFDNLDSVLDTAKNVIGTAANAIAEKTVDRISEMASGAVMKIEGASLRNTKKDCIF